MSRWASNSDPQKRSFDRSVADDTLTQNVATLTFQCIRIFKASGDSNSPDTHRKINIVRRFSRKAWRSAQYKMRDIAKHRPMWQSVFESWKQLGEVLEVEKHRSADESEDHTKAIFSPWERCAWKQCLCSVHKPIHRMRVCKGCYRVAYCNANCQHE